MFFFLQQRINGIICILNSDLDFFWFLIITKVKFYVDKSTCTKYIILTNKCDKSETDKQK